jgi:DNA-binding GntR family transcriptional regulator
MGSQLGDNSSASRVDVALRELRKAIEQRHLVPGEPLRLGALSQRLNMSVQPIREAIRLLEAEGLVERSNNKGSVVAKVSLPEIVDLCAIRTSLEPMMIVMATQRATDEELASIRRAHERLRALIQAGYAKDDLIQASIDWHAMLHAAARSRFLSEFIDQTWAAVRINSSWSGAVADDLVNEHEAILVAMENRDHQAAAAAMQMHLRGNARGHIEGFTGASDAVNPNALAMYEQMLSDMKIV